MAMMVVAAGVSILAAAMAMMPGGEDDVQDSSRLVIERIISDERWALSPGVLLFDEVDEISFNMSSIDAIGCRAVLHEVGGPTVVLFEEGQIGGEGERLASSRAVNVHHGPQYVTAGTVTVWVWI